MDFSIKEHSVLFSELGHSKKEGVLHKVLEAVSWPDQKNLVDCLNSAMKHGNFYMTRPKDHGAEGKEAVLFWVALVNRYNIGLTKPFKAGTFFTWLLTNGYPEACNAMLEHTSQDDISDFLSEKTDIAFTTPTQRTAYDKVNTLQALVMNDQFDVLKKIAQLYPAFINIQDKKDRTALFAVKSDEMLDFLLEQGIDTELKNKDGRTALEFFSENKYSSVVSWSEKIAQVSSSPESSVALKIINFNNKLSTEEKEILDDAVANIKEWEWEGRLGGLDRSWSLPEMWKMAELLFAIEETVRPSFDKEQHSYYYHYNPRLFREPSVVMEKIHHARSLFPSIQKEVFSSKRTPSAFEKAIEYLMEFRQDPKDADIISYKTGVGSSYNSPHTLSMSEKIFMEQANKYLKKMDPSERDDFNKAMVGLLRQEWSRKQVLRAKVMAYMDKMALPLNQGGMGTKAWTDAVVEDRQGTGLRHEDFIGYFSRSLAQHGTERLWYAEKQKEVPNFDQWKGVLRTGLCYGGVNENPVQHFMPHLQDMITQGVPMEKVPLRWTRHFSDELKAATSKWIITSSLEKKIQKKETATC